MATTIQQAFQVLRQNLQITDLQASTVSSRQKHIRELIQKEIDLVEPYSFLADSYKRSTMIAPLKQADVDIFFTLNPKYFHHYNNGKNGGQAGLLDRIKRLLVKTYPKTPDIGRNGQAVTIRFSDFVVDVVPGFHRNGGGFLIPNSISSSWIPTDPQKHTDLISSANTTHGGDLVPLIKMIKAWNKKTGKYFTSFHLEVLALDILNNVRISDFPSGIRFFFDKGRTKIAQKNPDPAGYGQDIGSYINTKEKIDVAVDKFQLAYERALKAEEFEKRGRTSDAMEMWAKIFGDYFPTYG